MGVMYTQIHVEAFCSSGGDYDPSLSGQEDYQYLPIYEYVVLQKYKVKYCLYILISVFLLRISIIKIIDRWVYPTFFVINIKYANC